MPPSLLAIIGKIDVDVVALVNKFYTSSVKCWTANFCIYAIKGPVIIVNQLKYINNSPFKDLYPVHTYFLIIDSNDNALCFYF